MCGIHRAIGAGQASQSRRSLTTFLIDLLAKVVGTIYVHLAICIPQQFESIYGYNLFTNDGPDHSKFASYGYDSVELFSIYIST